MNEHQLNKTKIVIYAHKDRLVKNLAKYIINLAERAAKHDDSKLEAEELEAYASVIDEFKKHKFGSPEYNNLRKSLDGALIHHFENNRHHPEYFEHGINDMDLVDVMEMLADWKAATENTGGNGDLLESISILSAKYKINPQLVQILINTSRNFGFIK